MATGKTKKAASKNKRTAKAPTKSKKVAAKKKSTARKVAPSSKKSKTTKKVAGAKKAASKSRPKKAAAPKKKAASKAKKVAAPRKAAAPKKAAPAKKAPAKKAGASPSRNVAPAAPKKPAAPPAATYLGRADAMNASISMLLVDGAAAAEAWKGVDPDDFDAIEKIAGNLTNLQEELDSGRATSFSLGSATGVGFQLAVGKGIAHVFRAKDRIVIAEGFVDDVENADFLGWVATPPSSGASEGGSFDVESGVLAMLLPGGAYEDLPGRIEHVIEEGSAARVGSDTPGLLVKMAPARYRLLVEPETTGAFGQVARAVLERA